MPVNKTVRVLNTIVILALSVSAGFGLKMLINSHSENNQMVYLQKAELGGKMGKNILTESDWKDVLSMCYSNMGSDRMQAYSILNDIWLNHQLPNHNADAIKILQDGFNDKLNEGANRALALTVLLHYTHDYSYVNQACSDDNEMVRQQAMVLRRLQK